MSVETGRLDANAAVEGGAFPFFTCSPNALRIDSYAFDAPAILLSGNAAFHSRYYEGKFNAYQRVYVLTSPSLASITLRYLNLVLAGSESTFRMQAGGGVIHYLRLPMVRDFWIHLPPLPEQRRIVDLIDAVDAQIEAADQAVERAERARRGLLRELLAPAMRAGWQEVRLEDVCLRIGMGPFGSNIKVDTFVAEGVPVISGAHLHQARLTDHDFRFITQAHANRLKGSAVGRGDVVLTHAGTVGQASVIPDDSAYENYMLSQRQFFMRPDPALVLSTFLVLFLRAGDGHRQLLSNVNRTGVSSLSRPVRFAKQMRMSLPPLPDQRRIVDLAAAADSEIGALKALAGQARELRKGLLTDLLSGDHEIPASYDRLLAA